jgi:hypothetical protein
MSTRSIAAAVVPLALSRSRFAAFVCQAHAGAGLAERAISEDIFPGQIICGLTMSFNSTLSPSRLHLLPFHSFFRGRLPGAFRGLPPQLVAEDDSGELDN